MVVGFAIQHGVSGVRCKHPCFCPKVIKPSAFHVLTHGFQEVEADVEYSHEKDYVLKLGISSRQFLSPAVQRLVSCDDGMCLAYAV